MKILKSGVYLVVFCLPLYLIKFSVLGLPTNVLEAIILTLFLAWLIKNKISGIKEFFKNKTIIWPVLLIFVGVVLATIFSWDLRLSMGILKGWFIIPFLFFMVLITTINQEEIKKVLNTFVLSGFVVSVISLIYLILGKLDVHGRLQGIYNSPNYLAMYLAPALIIGIGYYVFTFLASPSETRSRMSPSLSNIFVFFLISCFLLSVFFTKSYGALLGLLGAMGFGVVFHLYKRNKKWLALSIIIIGFIFILIFGLIKIKSLDGLKSFDARFVIWETAINSFTDYPITGIGPGTFEYYFPPYPKWGVPQPHSIYFAFLLQTGIIGFIGFIWLLIWFFKIGIKQINNHLSLIIMMVMTYTLTHGLVDTTYWKNDLSVFFWIIIGLMIILSRPESRLGPGQKSES